jgi:hypothetical protein
MTNYGNGGANHPPSEQISLERAFATIMITVLYNLYEWFKGYPSVSIEQVGTPYNENAGAEEPVTEYDYIIIGGL